jgi:AbrB family looped-hinge helix DNA binding protein
MARYRPRTAGGNRIRETAPPYVASDAEPAVPPAGFVVVIADRGRLVLPAAVRERFGIKAGDRLTLWVETDGTMRLQTAAAYARSLRGMFKHLAVPGRSVVDELIAERRREARMDGDDVRALPATSRAGGPRGRRGA